MKILGIESATPVCAAAVAEGGRILSEQSLDGPHLHSERLVLLVDEALTAARTAAGDLDGIAVSIGPGSFTGLRVGLSVAKGLAYATGVPLVAVPTLEAAAFQAVRRGEAAVGDLVAPMIDARREEVYFALYEVQQGGLRPLADAGDADVAALVSRITGERRTVLCGDGASKFMKAAGGSSRFVLGGSACSAAAVALLGEERLASGAPPSDLASLEPFYVKEFSSTARL